MTVLRRTRRFTGWPLPGGIGRVPFSDAALRNAGVSLWNVLVVTLALISLRRLTTGAARMVPIGTDSGLAGRDGNILLVSAMNIVGMAMLTGMNGDAWWGDKGN